MWILCITTFLSFPTKQFKDEKNIMYISPALVYPYQDLCPPWLGTALSRPKGPLAESSLRHGLFAMYIPCIPYNYFNIDLSIFFPLIRNHDYNPWVLISLIKCACKGRHKIDCVINLWACNRKPSWSIVCQLTAWARIALGCFYWSFFAGLLWQYSVKALFASQDFTEQDTALYISRTFALSQQANDLK